MVETPKKEKPKKTKKTVSKSKETEQKVSASQDSEDVDIAPEDMSDQIDDLLNHIFVFHLQLLIISKSFHLLLNENFTPTIV